MHDFYISIIVSTTYKHNNMAKKVVATLKVAGKGKEFSKVITMNKSPRTGAYSFKEQIVANDFIKDAIAGKL
jgi:hypothetical protein